MPLASQPAERLSRLLQDIYGRNPFYTKKLDAAGFHRNAFQSLVDLKTLPLTTKQELIADQQTAPPWGTNLTEHIDRYTRYSQTSSTTGVPLRWLDTNESWQWMLECWKAVFAASTVSWRDRILFPFSFGPFLGFWTAFEAGCQIGAHCIPAGGMSSQARLTMIDVLKPSVVCCTPTYALRLMEVAAAMPERASELQRSSVRVLIVAGEPGGSIASTRKRIEEGWGARVIDHHGLTEVGPVSFQCWDVPGSLHLNEDEFICEVLEPGAEREVSDGERGELVVTNLGRTASPLIRYRTGDIVMRQCGVCECGRTSARLEGGILARVDEMVIVRGVNVYPSAVEEIVRQFSQVAEYRATVGKSAALSDLSVEIELNAGVERAPAIATELSAALRESLGLTVPVKVVEPEVLPRFEMKSKRFVIGR
jgi:phenylacetate-CoA ligase